MCLEVVDRAVKRRDPDATGDPPLYWDVIAESWRARDPSLYGRMDFGPCGNAPVKLLGTTPIRQPRWVLIGLFPVVVAGGCPAQRHYSRDADQYNAIQNA